MIETKEAGKGIKKGFRITYEIITPESAEQGGAADSGWVDEDGVDMEPDAEDVADGVDAVRKAILFLRSEQGSGGLEASSSGRLTEGCWWTSYGWDSDLQTGAEESHSYHPVGFTEDELNAINDGLK